MEEWECGRESCAVREGEILLFSCASLYIRERRRIIVKKACKSKLIKEWTKKSHRNILLVSVLKDYDADYVKKKAMTIFSHPLYWEDTVRWNICNVIGNNMKSLSPQKEKVTRERSFQENLRTAYINGTIASQQTALLKEAIHF